MFEWQVAKEYCPCGEELSRGRCPLEPFGENEKMRVAIVHRAKNAAAMLAEMERLRKANDDLYAEVNAYMNPTAQRMSSREGLRQALDRYRTIMFAAPSTEAK